MGMIEAWMRALHDERPLRLRELAAGLGVAELADAASSEAAIRDAAHAARRCVFCSRHSQCDALLAARDWKGVAAICPNAAYLARLQAQASR